MEWVKWVMLDGVCLGEFGVFDALKSSYMELKEAKKWLSLSEIVFVWC